MKPPYDQYQHPLQPSSDTDFITGVPLGILIPAIVPHLDKHKVKQLQLHYTKLRRNEIRTVDFIRFTRQIAGRQLLQRALENVQFQIHTQPSSANTPPRAGINAKISRKRLPISQKEQLEAHANHFPLPSCKKKKVSGATQEQCIGELNDITALLGVNMREEKQLVAAHKEELGMLEAAQKVLQEEERLILQKTPLQRKLAEIISKYGITCISNNVERCLSMCVEKRMHRLIRDLIRLSKKRVDFEKPIHRTSIPSDVHLQILMMNRKAKEVSEEHQAEEDVIFQKLNEREFEGIAKHFQSHPQIRLILKYDEALSHSIYAASDMFIIPSVFEPCGLTQMIAMRYGAVPIARKTGGLNDSVFDVEDDTIPLQFRNGFTFSNPDEQGASSALERSFTHYTNNSDSWQKLVQRNMKIDFSWDSSASQYIELYEKSVARAKTSKHS